MEATISRCHGTRLQPHIRTMHALLLLFFLSLCFSLHLLMVASQQQPWQCPRGDNAGYPCEPSYPGCETLAYFRVRTGPLSSSLSSVAIHFNTTPSAIANASGLSSLAPDLNAGEGLYIPLTCTCSGNFSSHNTIYTIMPKDTFITIGSSTYEGLTTCQAIEDANPQAQATDLQIGNTLILPLRCACPSATLQGKGIKILVTYPVGSINETISSVIDMFAVNRDEFLSVNQIRNASESLLAATTVLLPFKEKPTLPPNVSFIPPSPRTSPENKVPLIASAAAVSITVLILIAVAASCVAKRGSRRFREKL